MEKAVLRNNHRWAGLNVWVIRVLLVLNVCNSLAFLAGTAELAYILFMHKRFGFINSSLLNFFSRYVWTAHQLISWISAVIFIVWLYRSYSNLYLLKINGLYFRFWTIAAWFIPVVNLFMPYRVVRNLFIKTMEAVNAADSYESERIRVKLKRWWGLWLYCVIGGNTALLFMFLKPPAPPAGFYLTLVYVTTAIAAIPLCVVTLRLIGDYRSLEKRLLGQQSEPFALQDEPFENLIDQNP